MNTMSQEQLLDFLKEKILELTTTLNLTPNNKLLSGLINLLKAWAAEELVTGAQTELSDKFINEFYRLSQQCGRTIEEAVNLAYKWCYNSLNGGGDIAPEVVRLRKFMEDNKENLLFLRGDMTQAFAGAGENFVPRNGWLVNYSDITANEFFASELMLPDSRLSIMDRDPRDSVKSVILGAELIHLEESKSSSERGIIKFAIPVKDGERFERLYIDNICKGRLLYLSYSV